MTLDPLPIDAVIPEILAQLDRHRACVVHSPPGSGKTTRVPAAVLENGVSGEVWVLQPRRLAARAAARRVAQERGGRVGGEVGYQVRHDRRVSKATRIRFVTEGILVRQLVSDPFLPGIGAVVLDEFHERSLESDLALAMLAEVGQTVREDLRILVMSATLEVDPVAEFLAPCGVVGADGQLHEVQVHHLPGRGKTELARTVRNAVARALEDSDGDILVFLPGVREIQDAAAELRSVVTGRSIRVLPLHGRLTAQEQDAAIVPGPERKVVLATNVAETSITIEGVTGVIDAGLARVLRHDSGRGIDRLELREISRASAEQRRGRAGRTGPGHCYRLWSAAEERGMVAFDTPAIRRLDLTGVVLQVRAFAGRDPEQFGWFDPPSTAALARADELLRMLGALSGNRLSELGQAILNLPLHPRLGRMLEEGRRRGFPRVAAELAGLLAERDIDRSTRGDLFAQLELLHQIEEQGFSATAGRRLGVDVGAARAVARARDQMAPGADPASVVPEEDLVKTLLAGFPDRVCSRKSEDVATGVMASGRGFRVTMDDFENLGVLFLALSVRESGGTDRTRALVSMACPLEEDWLTEVLPGSVRVEEVAEFVRDRGTVVVRRRRMFGAVVLEERSGGTPDPAIVLECFVAELRRDLWHYLGPNKELRSWLARLEWLRSQRPGDPLPEIAEADIAEAAASLCVGKSRIADLRKAPVLSVLKQSLTPSQQATLSRDAPSSVDLPSGRRVRIDYTSGSEPFVAARIQEFFGMRETPRLAGGRVPLLLHLLAPNRRPVQITTDLASFWKDVYPVERLALRRRYPKHDWPGDPTTPSG